MSLPSGAWSLHRSDSGSGGIRHSRRTSRRHEYLKFRCFDRPPLATPRRTPRFRPRDCVQSCPKARALDPRVPGGVPRPARAGGGAQDHHDRRLDGRLGRGAGRSHAELHRRRPGQGRAGPLHGTRPGAVRLDVRCDLPLPVHRARRQRLQPPALLVLPRHQRRPAHAVGGACDPRLLVRDRTAAPTSSGTATWRSLPPAIP